MKFSTVVSNFRKSFAPTAPTTTTTTKPEGMITLASPNIRVSWDRYSPKFDEFLARARALKVKLRAKGYDGNGGWHFPQNERDIVLETFKGFAVDSKVLALTVAPPPEPCKLGRVELRGNEVFLSWGQVSREEFAVFYDHCKNIRTQFGGGFSKVDVGWYFPIEAASDVVAIFGDEFSVDPKLVEMIKAGSEYADAESKAMEEYAEAMLANL
jgi:hypothetical protein